MAENRPVKVAIHGYYGFHNAGDEAILSVILQELRREIPDADPVVLSADPDWTEKLHGVRAVNCFDLKEVAACVREADLVISGGGGLFQDYWPRDNAEVLTFPTAGVARYSQVPLLAKLYGKPLLLLAQGVGPLRTAEVPRLVRFTFDLADRVTVRDEGSLAILQNLGCAERTVAVAPDPAFAFPTPPRRQARRDLERLLGESSARARPLVGVCLRIWEEGSPDWPQRVAEALDILVTETDALAVFVPFQRFESNHDVTQSQAIVSAMAHGDRCRILDPQRPAEVAAMVAGCDAVLAMRLHAAIFAIAAGVPVLALEYDPKVREAMRQAGQEEHVVDMSRLDPSGLAARLKALLDNGPAISQTLSQTAARLREQVGAHFEGLAALVEAAEESSQRMAGPEQETIEADRVDASLPLVDLKEQTVQALQAQLQETEVTLQSLQDQIAAERQRAMEQLAEREEEMAALRAQVERDEEARAALRAQVAEHEEAVAALRAQMAGWEEAVAALRARAAEREAAAAELEAQLEAITSSTGWALLQVLWRIRLFLVPRGGLRERILALGMRGLNAWRREGVFAFPLKVARRALRAVLILLYRLAWPLIRLLKGVIRPLLPEAAKKFYREFRHEYPFVDKSEVVLYADRTVLPDYEPRQSIEACLARAPAADLKVSLVTTVRNEELHAREWLRSLLAQSRYPDEVVIVDGGSTDGTVETLREFAKSAPMEVRVIEAPGANIAEGRNIAIRNATHRIVACTDFGCILHEDWLRLLVMPFEVDSSTEFSAGYYESIETDPLRASFFVLDLEEINPQSFLPSSRCIAMKKTFWAKVGGYPEWLTDAGEDTLFDLQAKSYPARWAFVPQAKVHWRAPTTLTKIFRTVFRYAKGDGEAGLFGGKYVRKAEHAFQLAALLVVSLLLAVLAVVVTPWALLPCVLLLGASAFIYGRWFVPSSRSRLGPRRLVSHLVVSSVIVAAQILGFAAGVANRARVTRRQKELYGRRLEEIIAAHPERKGIIIYPPTHDWGFMFQRPHQMARALARRGYLYFFCTNNERTDTVVGFQEVEPYLYLCHVPLETFTIVERPTVYIGSPWHRSVLSLFDRPRIVYDHYDDLEVSSGKKEDHQRLLEAAEVVVVTSERLREAARERRPDVLLVPNGVDYDYIQQSRPQPGEAVPADWEPIAARGRPIIGYSGALAQWFDYDLLGYAAKARPDLEFVLIGTNYDGSLDRSGVVDLPNVHWLGMKAYDELFKYVWRFDIGIIPFRVNSTTLATSPIKLFEYMACQKPAVTTPLPECQRYQEVFVAETRKQFVDKVDQALAAREDPTYLSRIERLSREHTWESRAETIYRALEGGSVESLARIR